MQACLSIMYNFIIMSTSSFIGRKISSAQYGKYIFLYWITETSEKKIW